VQTWFNERTDGTFAVSRRTSPNGRVVRWSLPRLWRRLVVHLAAHELVETRNAEVEMTKVLSGIDEALGDKTVSELG
jgi:hypothetical protein